MIKLIVGLCNPGIKYYNTRHNVGFLYLKELTKLHNNKCFKDKKIFFGLITDITLHRKKIFLLLPQTFMNLSGIAVKKVMLYYNITPNEILVVHDDVYLDVGYVKLKKFGGHGGHNGIKNIITNIKSKNFYRLKIGIGKPIHKNIASYVLDYFSSNEKKKIKKIIKKSITCIDIWFQHGYDQAVHFLNTPIY